MLTKSTSEKVWTRKRALTMAALIGCISIYGITSSLLTPLLSLILESRGVGQALVQHPLIKAVGFTGSLAGGKALFDFCAAREEPIPFFGELGSVNPMFLLPQAIINRGGDIASGWVGSLTMGAGQFCTNPGIAIVIDGTDVFSSIFILIKILKLFS